jgi:hypothetical protein
MGDSEPWRTRHFPPAKSGFKTVGKTWLQTGSSNTVLSTLTGIEREAYGVRWLGIEGALAGLCGLLRGFRTVVSVDFLCCEDVLLVSVVDLVGPLVAKR